MKEIDYSLSKYYENRELSWIKFNERVLTEAEDKENPLFERLKFLSIVSSNMDEFIMVRVASLRDMLNADYDKKDIAGMTVIEQLNKVSPALHKQVERQYKLYNEELVPELLRNNLRIVNHHEELTTKERVFVDEYFDKEIYPVLTPMAVDSSRPFPLIRNKSLNIGALVTKKEGSDKDIEFATVQVPSGLPRIVQLPYNHDEEYKSVILLEEVIERNMDKLFLNYDIVCAHPFRVMRNADLSIDEDEAEDLLKEIERQIRMRQWGEAIRLEIEKGADKRLVKIIREELMIIDRAYFEIEGPLDLTFLMKMYSLKCFDYLKEHEYAGPQLSISLPEGCNIFDEVAKEDKLLFHPYETFNPVVDFIRQSAKDPYVLAIKQTLYRVSGNSPIIAALALAAENGKQVTVLVELKARFDEENNILWARRLEQAGCHVIYGLVGLKTHSKITLVVRREEEGIKRYVHLGTGNYNDSTAKLYTDIGLLTADEAIGEDATAVFNMLSGYSEPRSWNKLSLAPLWLKDRFLYLIDREKRHAINGEKAHIIAKMNSVCDPDVIKALYEAAAAGVKIDLIVRGICCIKTDVPGIEDRIQVRSIVGNFLEHARIFYFENGGKSEYYCASADWMPRNLERRVEILFPVEKPELRHRLEKILITQLFDNRKAHELQKDGSYKRVKDLRPVSAEAPNFNAHYEEIHLKKDIERINSQLIFCKAATDRVIGYKEDNSVEGSRVFIPKMNPEG